ncbi:MAG: hypothetical protein WCG02_04340 [Candidatus Taylorbacteria bacterium]
MKETLATTRLEAMLRFWEQTLFLAECDCAVAAPAIDHLRTGAVVNWRDLRKAILTSKKNGFNLERFTIPDEVISNEFNHGGTYQYIPAMVHSWSHSSRRVYSLSETLQKTLEMTSVGRVTWDDIHPPFPCFAVSLPIPITWKFGNNIDTIIVEFSGKALSMIAIGNEMDAVKFLGKKLTERLDDALRHSRTGKLEKLLKEVREDRFNYIPQNQMISTGIVGPVRDTVLPQSADHLLVYERDEQFAADDSFLELWMPVYRIVLGLCLHLELSDRKTMTTTSASGWTPVDKPTIDRRAIIDGAQLCSVDHETKLTADEEGIFVLIRKKGAAAASRELSSHFRSAYWRRPPGMGEDPSAPKSVRVRWTIVNERRLPEDALPPGTQADVT